MGNLYPSPPCLPQVAHILKMVYMLFMPTPRIAPKKARKIAEGLAEGKSQVQACVNAGVSQKTARKRGYIICKRPEIFMELAAMGAIIPDKEIGEAAKAVLVHKLAEHASLPNRELATFLQMSLQTGKKIGQHATPPPSNQVINNVQVNMSLPKVVQDLLTGDMLGTLGRHFGQTVEVIDSNAGELTQGELENVPGTQEAGIENSEELESS